MWSLSLVGLLASLVVVSSNHDAKRLYDVLLKKNEYNRLIRPVKDSTDSLNVKVNLKLSAIIDVDEKNEIISTNVWLMQEWLDSSLTWSPEDYGNVTMLYVPSDSIWLPDIVLYNNADGNYEITMFTKAKVEFDGKVNWDPPAIYKSQCDIDVTYFPFDEQECKFKFGSWTYDGNKLDMRHQNWDPRIHPEKNSTIVNAIDLTNYYISVEWDLMNVTASKTETIYPCCDEPYPDITFRIHIRRKTLYYTINLIIPCVSINLLTLLVFYLPTESNEKISITTAIMLSLSIFQLLLMELVPGTSLVTPMIGKYLLFTCVLVAVSIYSSVIVLNITYRSSSTHNMPKFIRTVFLEILPNVLLMPRPAECVSAKPSDVDFSLAQSELLPFGNPYRKSFKPVQSSFDSMDDPIGGLTADATANIDMSNVCEACARRRMKHYPPNVHKALDGLSFVANHLKSADDGRRDKDDWKYLGLVVDRLLLYIYITVCLIGGFAILLNAPVLYDTKKALPSFGR